MLKAIVAVSSNNAIGRGNALPWHIPSELAWFKQCTLGHTIVMGRKTFESIGRPLPGRSTVVLTRQNRFWPGVRTVHEMSELSIFKTEVWICGGSQVYELALPYCSDLYLTEVHRVIEDADSFFPEFRSLFIEKAVVRETSEFTIRHYIQSNPRKLNA